MRKLQVTLGIIGLLLAAQIVGIVLLALLVYQATPKGVLAHETFIGKVPGLLSMVRIADRMLNVFYVGPRPPEALPQYRLTIDPADLRKIEKALPDTPPSPWYGNLFLQDENQIWVKGEFQADGETYSVDVRVRGDLFNHWAYRKKSWRIRFPKEKLWRGMREITLIIPEDRAWFGEILNVERAQRFGLPQPPTRFVTMSLNGSAPMLYVEFEHWTKEMLEKLGFSNANLYQTGGGTSYFQQWDPIEKDTAYWKKYVSASSSLDSSEEVDLLLHDLSPQKVKALFDEEQLVRWYAHSLLAGSKHVIDHNIRLLFDRSRGKFIPIPWDVHLYTLDNIAQPPINFLWRAIFSDPMLRLRVYRFLWGYVSDKTQVQSDIDRAEYLRALIEGAAYRDSMKLPSNRAVKNDLDTRMAQVRGNFETITKELSLSEVLVDQRFPSKADRQRGVVLTLDLTVRGVSPALLYEIHLPDSLARIFDQDRLKLVREDGREVSLVKRDTPDSDGNTVVQTKGDDALLWINFADDGVAPHVRHRFFLRFSANVVLPNSPLHLDIRNAVTGKKATVIGESVIDDRTFEHLSSATADRNTFLKSHPEFEALGNGVRVTGTHTFFEDVIVPKGVPLTVSAGATLWMGSGVSLVSYSPVFVNGTSAAPIRFVPAAKQPWGVFGVLNAEEHSSVSWAEFDGGGQDDINGTFMSGMAAFHRSPVTIRDSVFRHAHGDDGLNIKYIPADLARLRFEDNVADAVDIDIASGGVLEDSTFTVSDIVDSNGDGIDLSLSHVTLRNIVIRGSGDKCISIGEHSDLLIQNALLEGCSMGIAVKDGSKARAERVQFTRNGTAISAYIKKPIFDAPSIDVRESVFRENKKKVEILNGATITIDGTIVNP